MKRRKTKPKTKSKPKNRKNDNLKAKKLSLSKSKHKKRNEEKLTINISKIKEQNKVLAREEIENGEIIDLINSYNNNIFGFSEDEEESGFENFEKNYKEDNELNIEKLCNEEKEKNKYLFKIQKNLNVSGGNYDYVLNKFLKESNRGLNIEEEKEICEDEDNSGNSYYEEKINNILINYNNKIGDDHEIKQLTKSNNKIREEINSLFINYKKN